MAAVQHRVLGISSSIPQAVGLFGHWRAATMRPFSEIVRVEESFASNIESLVVLGQAAEPPAVAQRDEPVPLKDQLPSFLVDLADRLNAEQKKVMRAILFGAALLAPAVMSVAHDRFMRSRDRSRALFSPMHVLDSLKKREFRNEPEGRDDVMSGICHDLPFAAHDEKSALCIARHPPDRIRFAIDEPIYPTAARRGGAP